MQKILLSFCLLLIHSHYLYSNGPPENASPQPPVVTPHVPREAPPVRHNPGHS